MWKDGANGKDIDISFCTIKHPTSPVSFSNGDRPKLVEKTKQMLDKWNKGLKLLAETLHILMKVNYSSCTVKVFCGSEKPEIPRIDYPAGLPVSMRELDGWARRVGKTDIQEDL